MRLPTLDEINKELAERSLYEFVQQAWHIVEPSDYIDSKHIELICNELEAINPDAEEGTKDLLINIPPRHTKSLLVCVLWPAWLWIRKPHVRFLFSSYSLQLATRDNLKCRRLIQSDWYQKRWGDRFKITSDQNQKTRYENDKSGYRYVTSPDSGTTGEGGDVIVCDDPHNVTEAPSDAEREATVTWWFESMSTRRNNIKRGCRVVIGQRVHHKDLCGVIIDRGGYRHICLPAEYEPDHPYRCDADWRTEEGELLCSERFDKEGLEKLKNDLGSYAYAGQCQQRPVPREGGMFKRHWFEIVNAAPAKATRVRYWDMAASQDDGDYTAGLRMSKTDDGIYYIEDVKRDQLSSHGAEKLVKQSADLDGKPVKIWMEQEPGSAGKTVIASYTRLLAGYSFRGYKSTGKKEVRADPFAAQCEAGNVKIVKGPWNEAFLEELTLFPNGDHDDQVDAASGAFDKLANIRELRVGTRL
jgi:predicted phage terminase large subunit-like protein